MAQESSDTTLLARLKKNQDAAAAQELWQRYFDRLTRLARTRIKERQRRVSDEEDVALSAFDSFFRGVSAGRFARLDDRQDLWQILVMIAERKAIDQTRRHLAAKRGAGEVRGDSVFVNPNDPNATGGLDQLAGADPTPEFAALFSETCQEMLARLHDPELVQVALLRMEGYNNEEIAAKLGRVTRSVERKLRAIRNIWDRQGEQETDS